MKSAGWAIAAALLAAASAAQAQAPEPYVIEASPDIAAPGPQSPYPAPPPEEMAPRPAPPPGYAPLLPPREIYAIARESGFSPLGDARQRGPVYTLAVVDLDGDDGRLVVDARTGRIRRFTPAYRVGGRFGDDVTAAYGRAEAWPPIEARRPPRPPARIPNVAPRVASLPPAVPVPRTAPHRAPPPPKQAVGKLQSRPAQPPMSTQAAASAVTPADRKPEASQTAAKILPTQEMPPVQGLE